MEAENNFTLSHLGHEGIQRPPDAQRQRKDLVIGTGRRWAIYIVGLIETLLFGGCIFGWGQLVYVLKNEGIFSDLCPNSTTPIQPSNLTWNDEDEDAILHGCPEQDRVFALIYTIACIAFGAPGVLMGLFLHCCGLVIARLTASVMMVLGFLALGYTQKDQDEWLYVSMILLAVGGNQLRMCGFQFCNLFPNHRSTALTVISGCYSASAGLFMSVQIGQSYGYSLWSLSLILAGIASLSILATVIMPFHHIPYDNEETYDDYQSLKHKIPISESIFSISIFTHSFWLLVLMVAMTTYTVVFNSWITDVAQSKEEAGHYSMLYSMGAFLCLLVSPLPGLLLDHLSKPTLKDTTPEACLQRKLKSPVLPLVLVTCITLTLQVCLFFHHSAAIYVSLVALAIMRPSIIATANAFLRIRFPAEHFDRLIGIVGTVISILNGLQYPMFVWLQNNPLQAMVVFIGSTVLTLIHPLHLLSKSYLSKISRINQLECAIPS